MGVPLDEPWQHRGAGAARPRSFPRRRGRGARRRTGRPLRGDPRAPRPPAVVRPVARGVEDAVGVEQVDMRGRRGAGERRPRARGGGGPRALDGGHACDRRRLRARGERQGRRRDEAVGSMRSSPLARAGLAPRPRHSLRADARSERRGIDHDDGEIVGPPPPRRPGRPPPARSRPPRATRGPCAPRPPRRRARPCPCKRRRRACRRRGPPRGSAGTSPTRPRSADRRAARRERDAEAPVAPPHRDADGVVRRLRVRGPDRRGVGEGEPRVGEGHLEVPARSRHGNAAHAGGSEGVARQGASPRVLRALASDSGVRGS